MVEDSLKCAKYVTFAKTIPSVEQATEGYELGFVTAVVEHAKLMEEARRWAGQIFECSPMSIRATKQVVMRSLDVLALEMAMRNLS
jgi:enoyl-CoA hydratase/carnithine racemase